MQVFTHGITVIVLNLKAKIEVIFLAGTVENLTEAVRDHHDLLNFSTTGLVAWMRGKSAERRHNKTSNKS